MSTHDKIEQQDLKVLERILKRCGHEANYRRELGQRDWASEYEKEAQTIRRCISRLNAFAAIRQSNNQRKISHVKN